MAFEGQDKDAVLPGGLDLALIDLGEASEHGIHLKLSGEEKAYTMALLEPSRMEQLDLQSTGL